MSGIAVKAILLKSSFAHYGSGIVSECLREYHVAAAQVHFELIGAENFAAYNAIKGRCLRGTGSRVKQAIECILYILGGHLAAVMETHTLPELDSPAQMILCLRGGLSQPRLGFTGLGIGLEQRLMYLE